MSIAWKLVKKGEDDVFEAASVQFGTRIPAEHTVGVVIDTGSSEAVTIMMNLGEISNVYWMSRTRDGAAAIFPAGTNWYQARALLKRAADMRDAQILSYVEKGQATARVKAGLARMRRGYGF